MTGVERIAIERDRHEAFGWDAEHDDEHQHGELIKAAQCYSQMAIYLCTGVSLAEASAAVLTVPRWPWGPPWWKPSPDPIRNLEKAGALIAAEIDRLQRK